MSAHDVDAATGTPTTGHEWDGIKELNTPLPRWWVWVFYATVVWAIGYGVVYPAVPLITSFTAGVFGYSSRGQVAAEVRDLQAARGGMVAKLEAASVADIEKDQTLFAFATAQGGLTVERELTGGLAVRLSTPLVGASWSKLHRHDGLGPQDGSSASVFVAVSPSLELRLAF